MPPDVHEAIDEATIENLKDQFSGTTRVVRRNLLIAASLAILLSVDGIKLGNVLGIDLSSLVSAELAKGAISAVVIYELISFVVYAWIDQAGWQIKRKSVLHTYAKKSIDGIQANTKQVADQLNYVRSMMTSDDYSVVNAIKSQSGVMDKVVNSAMDAMESYNTDFAVLRGHVQNLNIVQWSRIYFLDWGIPLIVSSLAIYRNLQPLQSLFTAW